MSKTAEKKMGWDRRNKKLNSIFMPHNATVKVKFKTTIKKTLKTVVRLKLDRGSIYLWKILVPPQTTVEKIEN